MPVLSFATTTASSSRTSISRMSRGDGRRRTPHRHVDLLQHVLGFAALAQDTQADSKKLRRSQAIDRLQRTVVPAAYRSKGGGY